MVIARCFVGDVSKRFDVRGRYIKDKADVEKYFEIWWRFEDSRLIDVGRALAIWTVLFTAFDSKPYDRDRDPIRLRSDLIIKRLYWDAKNTIINQ